ncbi:TIGR01777 family oxidoreductase [Terriglobus tenax]|uniref:TIGR01777 family oxidoreductase n=1 Tax=Terriglobus tenax TaxID=1111115 RepID=UPI0021E05A98|nr:TIGR01777 family oxidoreductase [Terriglobus tenax]
MDQRVSSVNSIVILGGSGQIGHTLAAYFHAGGTRVVTVSRSAKPAPWTTALWDGRTLGPWAAHLEGVDAVINLAGSTINTRFTPENRKLILASRLDATHLTGQAIRACKQPSRVWINASAVDLYPHTMTPCTEADIEGYHDTGAVDATTPDSWRFISDVVWQWEQALQAEKTPSTRKIALRTTLMLSPDKGGVFRLLATLAKFGLGGPQGSGHQWMSWMHHQDYARAVEFLIAQDTISGPVNITSPHPLPNREFMVALRQAVHMPIGLPAPAFGIHLSALLLRTEPVLVLKSRRSVPAVLHQHGFTWMFPDWAAAARDLVEHMR